MVAYNLKIEASFGSPHLVLSQIGVRTSICCCFFWLGLALAFIDSTIKRLVYFSVLAGRHFRLGKGLERKGVCFFLIFDEMLHFFMHGKEFFGRYFFFWQLDGSFCFSVCFCFFGNVFSCMRSTLELSTVFLQLSYALLLLFLVLF